MRAPPVSLLQLLGFPKALVASWPKLVWLMWLHTGLLHMFFQQQGLSLVFPGSAPATWQRLLGCVVWAQLNCKKSSASSIQVPAILHSCMETYDVQSYLTLPSCGKNKDLHYSNNAQCYNSMWAFAKNRRFSYFCKLSCAGLEITIALRYTRLQQHTTIHDNDSMYAMPGWKYTEHYAEPAQAAYVQEPQKYWNQFVLYCTVCMEFVYPLYVCLPFMLGFHKCGKGQLYHYYKQKLGPLSHRPDPFFSAGEPLLNRVGQSRWMTGQFPLCLCRADTDTTRSALRAVRWNRRAVSLLLTILWTEGDWILFRLFLPDRIGLKIGECKLTQVHLHSQLQRGE